MFRKPKRKIYFLIFVLPTLAAFLIGFVYPFFNGIYLSFCKFRTTSDAVFIGFGNYVKAFQNEGFLHSFWFTVLFVIVSVILINLIAFFVAYALTLGIRGSNVFRTVFFVPNLVGGIILGYIWQYIFNGILQYYGTNLALNANFGFWGLVILMCWQQAGYMMIIYIAGFQSVPSDLYEAAKIDGASKLKQITAITLPLLRPTIVIMTLMAIGRVFYSDFGLFYQVPMNAGTLFSTTQTIDTYVYRGLMEQGNVGMSSAAGVYQSLVGFALVMIANFIVRKKDPENALF